MTNVDTLSAETWPFFQQRSTVEYFIAAQSRKNLDRASRETGRGPAGAQIWDIQMRAHHPWQRHANTKGPNRD